MNDDSLLKDPFGVMLLDYLQGDYTVTLEVFSDEVEIWTMSGALMMREYEEMGMLEKYALSLCRGSILDIGAGSGCHSLYLQKKGCDVLAIDHSPGCIHVMRKRGVVNVLQGDFSVYCGARHETILMLMNGIGICGTLAGFAAFLQQAKNILEVGGQIVADSTDISLLLEDQAVIDLDEYPGEVEFVMKYNGITSKSFSWLYMDFETMKTLASMNGFFCEKLMSCGDGRYLARLFMS